MGGQPDPEGADERPLSGVVTSRVPAAPAVVDLPGVRLPALAGSYCGHGPGLEFADVVDHEVEDALAHSFLAALPPEVVGRLREEGERADYPAGTTVYRAGSGPQAALVVVGLLRVYLMSAEGRQVTVRYARPSDVLRVAVLVGGPPGTGVRASQRT